MASSPSLQPSTPPPSINLHTPTTPKHGWEDNYEPFSPRKSARVLSQRSRAAHTPPNNLHASPPSPTSSHKSTFVATPNSAFTPRSSRMRPSKMAPKSSITNNTSAASSSLGVPTSLYGDKMESSNTVRGNGMLPTPAKTPMQKDASTVIPGISSVARNLFPIRGETAEDAMPSPKKKGRKKYGGLTMGEEDESSAITIYTDSHDRIPEADLSVDNPFYGQSGAVPPAPTKRSSKRRKIAIPGEGEQTIEEAERRTDGMIYVFRGKKVFRKFNNTEPGNPQTHDADAAVDAALAADLAPNLRTALTQSPIKPRLLFPTPEQLRAREMRSQATEDEEEADTDIDESHSISTPKDRVAHAVGTPDAHKFGPASPPITAKAARSKQVNVTGSPSEAEDGDHPTDTWSATVDGTPARASKKRGGEALSRARRGKKARGD